MACVPLLVETLICAMARPYSAWKIPLSTLNSCSASIRRQHEVGVEVRVRVFDSVERVMVVADALAGHIERERVARATHALLALRRRRAIGGGAGSERRQLKIVAPVQRQIHDTLVLDDRAQLRGFRLEDGEPP